MMKEYAGDSPGNPIRFRRPGDRVIILAIFGVVTLLALITCSAVAIAMAALFPGVAPFRWVFAGLFDGIGEYLAPVLRWLLAAFILLTDLVTMLSMGQFIPLFERLVRLVGSM